MTDSSGDKALSAQGGLESSYFPDTIVETKSSISTEPYRDLAMEMHRLLVQLGFEEEH